MGLQNDNDLVVRELHGKSTYLPQITMSPDSQQSNKIARL